MTSTPNDPAICSLCHRAHEGRWNPRHLLEPMTVAPRETSLRGVRAYTAERIRSARVRSACRDLRACFLSDEAAALEAADGHEDMARVLADTRASVSALISRLSAGSDEPRYNAAMTARRALGALWEVL